MEHSELCLTCFHLDFLTGVRTDERSSLPFSPSLYFPARRSQSFPLSGTHAPDSTQTNMPRGYRDSNYERTYRTWKENYAQSLFYKAPYIVVYLLNIIFCSLYRTRNCCVVNFGALSSRVFLRLEPQTHHTHACSLVPPSPLSPCPLTFKIRF